MKRLVLLAVSLTGCVTLQAATVGHVGCREDEIAISNQHAGLGLSTWDATCRGQTYICSARNNGRDGTQISCAPLVAPAAAAPMAQ